MLIPPLGIIDRVRRGEINFERLVEILRHAGYITEENQEAGCGFGSSAMEAVHQEDFEKLFAFFFPGEHCDIAIACIATDEGGQSGAYAYALFNSNKVSRPAMQQILERQNRKNLALLGGEV